MKTYMPLNGLRWSRISGSANCDMPQSAVFGRPGGEVWQSFFASRMLVCRSGKLLAGGSFRIGAVCVTSKNGNLMPRKIQMKRFGN